VYGEAAPEPTFCEEAEEAKAEDDKDEAKKK
jgi:hypothetical protein